MNFHVIVTRRARRDLFEISDWLDQRSPTGAINWLNAFDAAKKKISTDADQYRLAPESELAELEIHEVFFRTRKGRTYRALFVINGQFVYITHVRGPEQDFVDPSEFR